MEVVSAVLGPVLLVLSLSAMASQTHRVVRRRTTEGVSLHATMLGMMANAAWMTYGVRNGDPIQLLNNGPMAVGAFLVMAIAWKTGHLSRRRVPALTFLGFGLLLAAALFVLEALGMTLVLAALTITGRLPQVWEAWRAPGGEGLSVAGFALTIAASSGWVLYGCLHGQPAVIASGSYGILTTGFILVRTLQGRRRELAVIEPITQQLPALRVA